MVHSFDLIIIGSGPAGSAAAVTACRAGLRVALIDKANFPRDKLCGGLFTGRSRKALIDIFQSDVSDDLFLSCDHMRFLAKNQVLADITNAPPLHLTMRREFDAWLHEMALAAGCTPFLGQAMVDLDTLASQVTLKDGTRLQYRVLIGADGVNSRVATVLFGRAFDPAKIGFGLEIESGSPQRQNCVEIDLDAVVWGYGWRFPKHASSTVGVGGLKRHNPRLKVQMANYLTRCDLAPDDAPVKGQFLPFGDFRKSPGRGAILLCGDAAGLVDPITGEGIALAMESGQMAAKAAEKAMAANQPATAYHDYRRRLRPIHTSLREARLWRLIMFPDAMRAVFLSAFAKGSSLQMRYLRLLAGELDYRDLRFALLTKAPKAALRAMRQKLSFSANRR